MGTTTLTQTTNKDCWSTPDPIFEALNAEFKFALDVCANHKNSKVPSAYITEEQNALQLPWSNYLCRSIYSNFVWCNPPYSNISPWVEKATQELDNGIGTVMLVMSDHSVSWFSDALNNASECRLITNGRLSFINPETNMPQGGNNKGSAIFVFSPYMPKGCTLTTIDRDFLIGLGKSIVDIREAVSANASTKTEVA